MAGTMEWITTSQFLEDGQSPLASLPPECLRQIFQQLPVADWLVVENVCTTWRAFAHGLWSSLKSAEVHFTGDPLKGRILSNRLELAKNSLTKLKICSSNDEQDHSLAIDFVERSSKIFSLQSLTILDVPLPSIMLAKLGSTLSSSLVDFTFRSFLGSHEQYQEYPVKPFFDTGLQCLFQSCTALKKLDLHLDRVPPPVVLASIPKTVEDLSLSTHFYRAEYLDFLFETLASFAATLHRIRLSLCFDHHVSDWFHTEVATGSYLREVWKAASHIRSISLNLSEYFCREQFPLWGIVKSLDDLPKTNRLDSLILDGYEGIETSDIRIVATACPNLKILSLRHSKVGSEGSLRVLEDYQDNLKIEKLDITACRYYNRVQRDYRLLSFGAIYPLILIPSIRSLIADSQSGLIKEFPKEVVNFKLAGASRLVTLSLNGTRLLSNQNLWEICERISNSQTFPVGFVMHFIRERHDVAEDFGIVLWKTGISGKNQVLVRTEYIDEYTELVKIATKC